MQAANLDGLTEYISRGKNEFKLMSLDLDTMVSEVDASMTDNLVRL